MGFLDTFRLDGRVAVVTGASSGLGVTFARALAEAGADVVLGARREDRLAETVRQVEGLGRRALAVRTDVTSPEDCQRLVAAAMEEFGRLDVLVNNAGVGTAVPALKETPEQFRSVVDLNLNACYWMAQAAGRVMQPGSSIVNISSVLGLTTMGLPQAAYAASKAGLIGLTRDLAQQWTPRRGIRVNALAPGYFESEMTDQLESEYVERTVIPRTLMGRLGRHEEIGAALLFLASDASGYVTGTTLPVEGGVLTT
ncbi:SDR family NAD(P)-dependent oxidoreductase [Nocardioides antri]|uniref:Glucose 1-dehydrogenase n=1 Tax=Nocardioides antri TaxID=2607659 RepID=A0A5B1M5C8_9ACTN|nr:glucose 1-dehydrogenase [Nocardioides antri]KAA1426977.1 glucose 1-dehydrogenase [Nocardioides antri]